jgi:Bacitracin resistance protein BacA
VGGRQLAEIHATATSDARIAQLPFRNSFYIGMLQITALLVGISRSGVTMIGGLWRGVDHEDAARFAFLFATPPILAAGVLKLPSLADTAGAHIHGQVLLGIVVTATTAYLSVRFLVRYFQTRTLTHSPSTASSSRPPASCASHSEPGRARPRPLHVRTVACLAPCRPGAGHLQPTRDAECEPEPPDLHAVTKGGISPGV